MEQFSDSLLLPLFFIKSFQVPACPAETPEVGGQEWHVPPQVLGYQLTLLETRETDYASHITTGPPIFLEDAASLRNIVKPNL